MTDDIKTMMADIGKRAKSAAADLSHTSGAAKEAALTAAADAIWDNRADILAANERDMA